MSHASYVAFKAFLTRLYRQASLRSLSPSFGPLHQASLQQAKGAAP
jgi:hypothetical protein